MINLGLPVHSFIQDSIGDEHITLENVDGAGKGIRLSFMHDSSTFSVSGLVKRMRPEETQAQGICHLQKVVSTDTDVEPSSAVYSRAVTFIFFSL